MLSRSAVVVSLVLCLAALAACASRGSAPGEAERQQRIGPGRVTPDQIQSEVMTLVDNYIALVGGEMDDLILNAETPQRRAQFLATKLEVIQSALSIGASANPVVSLLDSTVMISLQHQAVHQYIIPEELGEERGAALGAVLDRLYADVWAIADRALEPRQHDELKQLIAAMRERYGVRSVSWIRASEFASARTRSFVAEQGSGNLFSLFALDPLSGLSPAARELAQTRLLAERAFFYAKRLPTVAGMQVQSVLLDTLALPESETALRSATQVADAAERVSEATAELPEIVATERAALIADLDAAVERRVADLVEATFDRVAGEREAIVASLRGSDERIGAISDDVTRAAEAVDALAQSTEAATVAATELVRSVRDGREPNPDRRPFDITEYQAFAESAERSLAELNSVVASLNETLDTAGWDERGERLEAVGASFVDRVFWRAMILVGVALGGLLAVLLIARPRAARAVAPSRAAGG